MPGIITLGIIAAAFVNLVISVTAQRESGVLKRRRATPVPAAAIIAGRALTAVVVALGITAVLLAIGWAAFGATRPRAHRARPGGDRRSSGRSPSAASATRSRR